MSKKILIGIISVIVLIAVGASIYIINMEDDTEEYSPNAPVIIDTDYEPKKANEYNVVSNTNDLIMYNYYMEYLRDIYINREYLWSILSKKNKDRDFHNSFKEFEKYCDSIITANTSHNTIKKYKLDDKISKKTYTIVDTEDRIIRFISRGIWNIEMELVID